MSSRWTSADDDAELEARRRKQKGEKRRLREEKQRKLYPLKAATDQQAAQEPSEPPSKRQRTKSPSSEQDRAEDAHLLEFSTLTFGPSRSLDLYEVLNNIEEGSYGFVSRAKLKASGEIVALKRLKLDHINSREGFPVTGLREIQTLRACAHPHIVNLREVVVGSRPVQE